MDPQPRRPDPVRDQRPGPRGRAGRRSPGRSRSGNDWIAPFYRSIATCLDVRHERRATSCTAQYAKAIDPSSGGRQMPGHYGNVANNLVSLSSPVATQILHAVGIALAAKIRKTGQVAMTSMGEGSSQPGRRPRGAELRGDPQAAVHPVRREQRLRDQRAGRQGAGRPGRRRRAPSGYGIPGVIVDGADVLACYARREGGGRPRAARRGADADRGQGHPPDRATRRTTSRRSTAPRRSWRDLEAEGPAAAVPRRSCATPAC